MTLVRWIAFCIGCVLLLGGMFSADKDKVPSKTAGAVLVLAVLILEFLGKYM